MILHRILQRDQVGPVGKQLTDQGIHGRGFAGTGRSHDHDHTGGQAQQLVDLGILKRRDTDAAPVQGSLISAQDTDHHLLAIDRRQRGGSHIQLRFFYEKDCASILRDPLFHDVHVRHDLQTRDHGILQLSRNDHNAVQLAVNTHADDQLLLRRFEMDIGCILRVGPLDDGIDQAHHRGCVFLTFG